MFFMFFSISDFYVFHVFFLGVTIPGVDFYVFHVFFLGVTIPGVDFYVFHVFFLGTFMWGGLAYP